MRNSHSPAGAPRTASAPRGAERASPAPYSYSGWCAVCSTSHRLDRSAEAVAQAHRLMAELRLDARFSGPGKMLGVLVGVDSDGEPVTLRSFSGMLDGRPTRRGFVGPTRSAQLTADSERETLSTLSDLSQRIAALDIAAARTRIEASRAAYDDRIEALETARRLGKAARKAERRELSTAAAAPRAPQRLAELAESSRRERRRLRDLRRSRDDDARPLEMLLEELLGRRRSLRAERKRRSRELQAAMHRSHGLVNFAGAYATLRDLFGHHGIPSGAAECCAPKLLHEAALRGVRPTGMAEFWWGRTPTDGSRIEARFYGACNEKCAPILGHQLCGAGAPRPRLPILFEDDALIVVDKPAGLLSVPGRAASSQDCVESRLRLLRPRDDFLRAVHRLDQATSGILLVARSAATHRTLSMAFADGDIGKTYAAVVRDPPREPRGIIQLPLRADPGDRPRQVVDRDAGKHAVTEYQVVGHSDRGTHLRLRPMTGRTHQLRVHCASPLGLGAPILGDELYGERSSARRLMLHAGRLELAHPTSRQRLVFDSPPDWCDPPPR